MTNNTPDLVGSYAREDLHVGLVCLNAAHGTLLSLALQAAAEPCYRRRARHRT